MVCSNSSGTCCHCPAPERPGSSGRHNTGHQMGMQGHGSRSRDPGSTPGSCPHPHCTQGHRRRRSPLRDSSKHSLHSRPCFCFLTRISNPHRTLACRRLLEGTTGRKSRRPPHHTMSDMLRRVHILHSPGAPLLRGQRPVVAPGLLRQLLSWQPTLRQEWWTLPDRLARYHP